MLTLLAKGVPFEVVNINLKSKPEWFLQQTWGTVSVVRYRKYLVHMLIYCQRRNVTCMEPLIVCVRERHKRHLRREEA